MTDKEKIRREIEKRYEYWREKKHNSHSIESEIRMSECQHLLLLFNSLQEEPVNKDLEEVATKYAQDKHLPVQTWQAFKAGAQWQKEQIMKDAVYGLVCGHDESSPAWIDLNLINKPNVKVGTEVKLIIIKDEQL